MKILFPEHDNQHYWSIHYEYVLNIFKHLNYNIEFVSGFDVSKTCFKCVIDGKTFAFDFSDSDELQPVDVPIFKFHTTRKTLGKCIPFPPVSFYDWTQYEKLSNEISYSGGVLITNRQRAYGNAIERRSRVKTALKSKFETIFRGDEIPQVDFWREIDQTAVSVCVGGHHSNMLDRGQLQYFGFGGVTVSANLPEILPFNTKIEPFVHYWECYNDYSNLEEIIVLALRHPTMCLEISQKAKQLFKQTCTPEAIDSWIKLQL